MGHDITFTKLLHSHDISFPGLWYLSWCFQACIGMWLSAASPIVQDKKERNEVMKDKLAMLCGYLVAAALSLTVLAAAVELSVADVPFSAGCES